MLYKINGINSLNDPIPFFQLEFEHALFEMKGIVKIRVQIRIEIIFNKI